MDPNQPLVQALERYSSTLAVPTQRSGQSSAERVAAAGQPLSLSELSFSSEKFVAKPLTLLANTVEEYTQAAWKANVIIRKCAAHESFFTDYIRGCGGKCSGFCRNLDDNCAKAQAAVIRALTAPDVMTWECWSRGDEVDEVVDFIGILRLSHIKLGCDAKAHYYFFDGKLRDKLEILESWNDWVFSDHPGWPAIHRITIEIPEHAFALARHAMKLGFGGDFTHRIKDFEINVEGVKQKAILWRGKWWDELIMGKINGGS